MAQDGDPAGGTSWLETIQSGGLIGYIIIGLSVIALAVIVMHLVQIRRGALLPPPQVEAIDEMLSRGDVNAALEYSLSPDHDSYLTRIMAAGLTRYQKSAFGAFELKNAIEEAGEDQTARLYRSTDALGVIGAIAPLLGLLGTVLGMVGAFESLSLTAGASHEELAANISLALVTTLLGLILAIPCVALFTFFRNRIDALSSEAAMEIERLTLYLESTPVSAAPPRGPAAQAKSAPMSRAAAKPSVPAAEASAGSPGGGGGRGEQGG
jgi:biopolymer transport protein ExbB